MPDFLSVRMQDSLRLSLIHIYLNVEEIRESGRTLVELIKESYRYRAGRVGQAIAKMEEES